MDKAVETVHKYLNMSKNAELRKMYAKNIYDKNQTFYRKMYNKMKDEGKAPSFAAKLTAIISCVIIERAKRGERMLYLAENLNRLSFSKLMAVYVEGNQENGQDLWPQFSDNEQLLRAEQAFYQYLNEDFFKTTGAVYAIWLENDTYVSALRLEPYQDGLLLEALETAPEFRKMGYAVRLIEAVKREFPGKIYSHVGKRNVASLKTHEKCGFQRILDYAVYVDGTVARNAYTLCLDRPAGEIRK